jgi:hypothetical protein
LNDLGFEERADVESAACSAADDDTTLIWSLTAPTDKTNVDSCEMSCTAQEPIFSNPPASESREISAVQLIDRRAQILESCIDPLGLVTVRAGFAKSGHA